MKELQLRAFGLVLFTSLFLAAGLPAKAQLADGIRCVQAQLAEAGYTPGPVDGIAGPQTRSALSRYQADHGQITARQLDFSLGNAVCRRIGLDDRSLRGHWPSAEDGTYVIHMAEGASPALRMRVELAARTSAQKLRNLFGVDLAGRDLILVGRNSDELAALVRTHYELTLRSYDFSELCDVPHPRVGGRAYPGMVLICAPSDGLVGRRDLNFAMAHELAHMMQFQLAGAVSSSFGAQAVVNSSGPIWLIEGMAQTFAYGATASSPDPEVWVYRNLQLRSFGTDMPDLSAVELHDTRDDALTDVYQGGAIAAADLIDLSGYPALAVMFELMGEGLAWPEAFETAFYVSVEGFYAHFERATRMKRGEFLQGPISHLSGQ